VRTTLILVDLNNFIRNRVTAKSSHLTSCLATKKCIVVSVFRSTITVRNQPTRSTQPCIPPGSLNRVPASAGWRLECHLCGSAGWHVTLCDPIWHVSSSSSVATLVSELLYACYLLLVHGI